MIVKFASFIHKGQPAWGLVQSDAVADLSQVDGAAPDLRSAIARGLLPALAAQANAAPKLALAGLTWLPVIPNPDKILCVGLNYEEHRKETGRAEVRNPTIFGRFANSQTGHQVPINRPIVSEQVDYEGELAIIIGKSGRYIPRAEAFAHIAGFSIYNDVSIRDYQHHTHQFTPGKNFPGTGALGPWMVTPDAMGPLGSQRIETHLNGVVVQSASFAQMIFDIGHIVEYCSAFTQLEPGDVIATGTPGGVGAKRNPPLWMKPGDVVTVSIEGIGTLSNPIVAEQV